ncbi:MAG: hypothetical protein ACREGI_03320 [Candidatus Levyibacteriota bacterium]
MKIKDALVFMLSVCNYPGDKQDYATRFEKTVHTQTFTVLVKKLPLYQQQEIEKIGNIETSDEAKVTLLTEYVSKEEYLIEFQQAAADAFVEFLEVTKESTSPEQKGKLKAYFETLIANQVTFQ